jgi:assimilatory nitrate reductase catalytic subunit
VIVRAEGGRVVEVRGDPDHPANRGRLCSKGTTLHLTMTPAAQAGRARHPELRRDRGAPRARASWDEALDHVAERFAATIAEHGPDAVAFYVSGQLLTEDYYAFNRLAKGTIGTANIDTNSRLCMSSAVSGYAKTLGVDGPPACYDDIEAADCLFIAGSNTAFAHPVLFRRIEAAKQARPSMKVIVVDPRARRPPSSRTCTSRSFPAPTSRSSTRCCTRCSGTAWWTRPISRRTPRASSSSVTSRASGRRRPRPTCAACAPTTS